MVTLEQIRKRATTVMPLDIYPGIFLVRPPIEVTCALAMGKGIQAGQVVHIDAFDQGYLFPNTVHLQEQEDSWWPLAPFDFEEVN